VYSPELFKGKIKKNLKMSPVRFRNIDILDQGNFFEYIFLCIFFVPPPVDDRKREFVAELEEHHDRHFKDFIDLSGDLAECGSCVFLVIEFNAEEEVGLDNVAINLGFIEKRVLAGYFFFGQLKEQVNLLPLFGKGLLFVETAIGVEVVLFKAGKGFVW